MEDINLLVEKIAQTMYDNVPVDNWDYATLEIKLIITFSESISTYFKNGIEKSFNPDYSDSSYEDKIDNLLEKLRAEMYELSPEQGAWFSAKFTITKEGDFNMEYNYDNAPSFDLDTEDIEYKKDFKRFPRLENNIPDWLKKRLES